MKKRCEAGIKKYFDAVMRKEFPHDTFYWSDVSAHLKEIWWDMYLSDKRKVS